MTADEPDKLDAREDHPPRLRRLRRRVVWAVAAVVVFVLGWYAVARITAPGRAVRVYHAAVADAPAPASGRPLKILAYNIAHGRGLADTNWAGDREARPGQIAELLKAQDADVVVLNEVDLDSSWSGRTNQGEFIANAAGYPWRAQQVNYDLSLPGFRLCFGNVILSRFPILDAHRIRYAS